MINRFKSGLLLLPLWWFLPCLQAQEPLHVQGGYLVSLMEGREGYELLEAIGVEATARPVAEMMNIWLIQTAEPTEREFLDYLRRLPLVRIAQVNHLLEHRSTQEIIPNDPHFTKQWHLLNDGSTGGLADADLDADEAWELSTGGITPAGDTIVMAVIDGGVDAIHPDLAPNLWRNRHETPNNGIDDDQNGFVDDVSGWNVFSANDDISGSITTHGTPVSAVLGAAGNNGTGVSGVNWDSRMLFVSALGTEAEVLAAYDYVWKTRKRYNETAGAKGAFVVAVNCSWGINFGQPSEAPLWCEAFDWMGEVGILSVAATANLPIDIDLAGDLPTACPSIYLVSVTSLNHLDKKAPNAAWGATQVDIAGYGQDIFSAASGSGYGIFSGTSFAAPQVTGAIGLLYGMICPNLITLAKNNPGAAAYWAKSLMMDANTPNEDLQSLTLSGGRLNLRQMLLHYQSQCSDCPAPFALKASSISEASATLGWITPIGANHVFLRWRRVGQGIWSTPVQATDSLVLTGLWSCTAYEFEVNAVCFNNTESAWSAPYIFETKGCCVTPELIWVEEISSDFIRISWEPTSYNNSYRIRFEGPNGTDPQLLVADTNAWTFTSLHPCSDYTIRIQARCDEWFTPLSAPLTLATKGCGACTESSYCPIAGVNASQEWIAAFQLGLWSNFSGVGGNGYQNFTLTPLVPPIMLANSVSPFSITPGFSGAGSKQYFRIFIDYNQDGDFMDQAELAYDPGFAFQGIAEGYIMAPSFEQEGLTRMRVMMRFSTPNDPAPSACGNFDFGQVEDYCVLLQKETTQTDINLKDDGGSLQLFPNPATDWAMIRWPAERFLDQDVTLRIIDTNGRVFYQHTLAPGPEYQLAVASDKWPAGLFVVEVFTGSYYYQCKLMKM